MKKYANGFMVIMLVMSSQIALGQDASPATGLLDQISMYLDLASQLVMSLVVAATIITRLIPGTADDAAVASFAATLKKYMGYLPTFGINPRTKELEAALEQLKNDKK
jgi:hypothetical protein